MKQFHIARENLLTQQQICSIIMQFQTAEKGNLQKRWNYYDGKQKILQKSVSEEKPSNKVVTNFVKSIVDNYVGYTTGIPVRYQDVDEKIIDVLNYNDSSDEDSQLVRDGFVYGRSAEIMYIDKDSKTRFKALDPRTVIPVYSDDLQEDLLYVIRFWSVSNNAVDYDYYVSVYDNTYVTNYKASAGFSTIQFIDQQNHFFNQVPVNIFSINKEEKALAEDVFSLQDAYNSIMSDNLDNEDAFADAYLVLKGITADENDLASMRKNRVLMIDSDSSAEYLLKDVNQSNNIVLLDKVEEKIRQISCCPDFSDSESFGTSSGIAIRYKLLGMENSASKMMNRFETTLRKRIEMIAYVENLKEDIEWRDARIIFERNIPVNLTESAQTVNSLRGIVSNETLLGMIPTIEDPAEEAKKVKAENTVDIYSMNEGVEE